MSEQVKKWYVIKVISGKEAKIQKLIENEVQRNGLTDYVGKILVPTEKVVQIRNNKRVQKDKTLFPGYIYIEANLSGELPHVIKSIPGVMGFLSGVKGGDPMPLSKAEVNQLLGKVDEMAMSQDNVHIPYKVGDAVQVNDGPFKGFDGVIEEVNKDRKKVIVMVKFFGRKTPLELGYLQVKKI
jgi:transcriptional antiterminator NusG